MRFVESTSTTTGMRPARSRQPLRILFVEKDRAARSAPAESLRERGHEVLIVDALEGIPVVHGFDVVVTEDDFGSRMDGAEVLERLGARDTGVPGVVLSRHCDFDRCRRAMRRGAVDFLLHPVEAAVLVQAVEAAALSPSLGSGFAGFVRHYFQGAGAHDRALRELGAHLMEGGLGPAHRIRITSAVGQVMQHLHERRGSAPLRLDVERRGERVRVNVGAMGHMALSAVQPALPFAAQGPEPAEETRHLELARALAEELELHSSPAREEASLVFTLSPVGFEEDPLDLADADYLDPRSIDRLLAVLLTDPDDQTHLVPTTMASTIGRLLAISNRTRTAETPLGS